MILQTASAPGTGSLSLIAPPTGRLAFSSKFSNGSALFYVLDDGTQTEWGYGTLTTGSPDSISRDQVIGNSANTTAKLNFAGTVKVYCAVPSANMIYMDKNGSVAINDTTATGFKSLAITAASSSNGAGIGLTGSGSNPTKYIRAKSGNLDILNSAYNAVLLTISDAGTLSVADTTASAQANVTFTGSANANGFNLKLIGNGATTPNKTIRVLNGAFQVINSAYNAIPLSLTDGGALTITGGLSATTGALSGTLSVGGAATLSSTLAVGGALTANGGFSMNSGSAVIGGNGLGVTGSSSATTSGWQLISTGTAQFTPGGLAVGVNASGKDMLATRYIAASDGRLKTDRRVITAEEGIKLIRECPPMLYVKSGAWESGHIAQDLIEAGLTEIVYRSVDPDMPASANGYSGEEGMRYEIQVAGVQAYHSAVIANLLDRIEALEAKLTPSSNP